MLSAGAVRLAFMFCRCRSRSPCNLQVYNCLAKVAWARCAGKRNRCELALLAGEWYKTKREPELINSSK